ncbi:MAG: hypothetical protein MRY83_19095 [Flavobacteriales bacterium]|nr:hypothetical protein [Flavobacteriales bacterium]
MNKILSFAFLVLCLYTNVQGQMNTASRDFFPIEFKLSNFNCLTGEDPDDIVGFSFDGSNWIQKPIQIDERDVVNTHQIYNYVNPNDCSGQFCMGLHLFDQEVYTDTGTHTGPDTDPTIDANDELVFMYKDAMVQNNNGLLPQNVLAQPIVEIEITDPITQSSKYFYLFKRSNNAIQQGAGVSYTNYNFNLIGGSYKNDFDHAKGPNPEITVLSTPYYETAFSDRWQRDDIIIKNGVSNPVDILDREKMQFYPGYCNRSELTFCLDEGAFITNKTGAIRTIRHYIGANSGPLTSKEHKFYEAAEITTTYLRVHQIPSIMNYFDWNSNAIGASYTNSSNTNGLSINGVQDNYSTNPSTWDLFSSQYGSVVSLNEYNTDINQFQQKLSFYFNDNFNPQDVQCTGDNQSLGASGIFIQNGVPNTDPVLNSSAKTLHYKHNKFFLPPNQNNNQAIAFENFNNSPLITSISCSGLTVSTSSAQQEQMRAQLRENILTVFSENPEQVFLINTLGQHIPYKRISTHQLQFECNNSGLYILMNENQGTIRSEKFFISK